MKRIKLLPDVAYLKQCFVYFSDTGELLWKQRPNHHFATSRACNTWNYRFAGKPAFTAQDSDGHKIGGLNGTTYLAHKVIWKLMTGEEGPPMIDHKDKRKNNNKWSNLRPATRSENAQNRFVTPRLGIRRMGGKWQARIKLSQQNIHLGTFDSEQEAIAARITAERKYFGEFSPR